VLADLLPLLALFGAGLVAGTLNVVAGGGSMLTLPMLIFLGLPPTVANGTNRVAILIQNAGAVWGFRRRGLAAAAWFRAAVVPVVVGAIAGTWVATRVGDATFQRLLAAVMLAAALWMVWRPLPIRGESPEPPSSPRARLALVVAWTGVGFFGGFIQAGIGFVILGVAAAAGLDLVRGNSLKVALVLAFTPISLALFARAGMVDWRLGLALAMGNLLGGQLGVHLTVVKGQAWIRRVVTLAVIAFAVRLWWGA
jgi:hypothetical protein